MKAPPRRTKGGRTAKTALPGSFRAARGGQQAQAGTKPDPNRPNSPPGTRAPSRNADFHRCRFSLSRSFARSFVPISPPVPIFPRMSVSKAAPSSSGGRSWMPTRNVGSTADAAGRTARATNRSRRRRYLGEKRTCVRHGNSDWLRCRWRVSRAAKRKRESSEQVDYAEIYEPKCAGWECTERPARTHNGNPA